MTLTFDVIGTPVPQGSKVAYGRRIVDANAKTLKPWRATVAAAALEAIPTDWDATTGPYSVAMLFNFPRPKSHYGTRGVLPSRADDSHAQKPDVDKLIRAVLDALTDAGVWRDDAQVCDVLAGKRWTTDGGLLRVAVKHLAAAL